MLTSHKVGKGKARVLPSVVTDASCLQAWNQFYFLCFSVYWLIFSHFVAVAKHKMLSVQLNQVIMSRKRQCSAELTFCWWVMTLIGRAVKYCLNIGKETNAEEVGNWSMRDAVCELLKGSVLNVGLQYWRCNPAECHKIHFDKSNSSFIMQMLKWRVPQLSIWFAPVSAFCLITDASQRFFFVWGGKTPGLGRGQAVLEKLLPLLRLPLSGGGPSSRTVINFWPGKHERIVDSNLKMRRLQGT